MTIYTVGHSTRAADELIALLNEAGVATLVDVRSYPRSKRNPRFNADVLARALAGHGVAYRHMKALGGLRKAAMLDGPSPNTLWRRDGFRNYADYALTPAFGGALGELRALAAERVCAVMCAEASWRHCHRQIIADYLVAAGDEVAHLVAPGEREAARLTPGAVARPDGTIHYPAAQGALL